MKAYNQEGIYNQAVVMQAERWCRQQLITNEQLTALQLAFPVKFRATNSFLDIGMFIFTLVACSGAYALFMLPVGALLNTGVSSFGVFKLAVGIVSWLLLNRYLGEGTLYHNGIDTALISVVVALVVSGVNFLLPDTTPFWIHCTISLPVLLLAVWYYGDTLIAFVAIATFYALIFSSMLTVSWGKLAMPFIIMAVSGLLYAAARLLEKRLEPTPADGLYYADALSLTQWMALIMLVLGGNYYIVRELNGLLMNPSPSEAPPISGGGLFWTLTFLIPLAYGYVGFRDKNRMFLVLSTLGLVLAVVTLRTYVHVLPNSVALVLGGLTMALVAIWGIRFLRTPQRGFTDVPDEDSPKQFFLNAEMLTVIQSTSNTMHQSPHLKFGGGDFDGGGAGQTY